jgi:flagellar protein FliS
MEPKPKKNPVDAYRRTEVLTASRETVLLMLYEGAIRFLKQAIAAAERNDTKEKARLLCKVQEIVTELQATLNFEAGGDLAKSLEGLYVFVSHRLVRGNLSNETRGLLDALNVLETLQSGWEGAVASLRKEKVSATTK